jgi:DNA-binding GntR family transcriptional regulator
MTDLPAYRRIAAELSAAIESGEYPPGAPLPSEQSLADQFGVTRPTVRQGLAELRATGVVKVVNGRGAFVADPAGRAEVRPDVAALRRERDTAWEMARREAAAVSRVLELADALDAEGRPDVASRLRGAVEGDAGFDQAKLGAGIRQVPPISTG